MMTLSHETFAALEAEIAALIDVLMGALSDPEASDDLEAITEGLVHYQGHVNAIGELAAESGLAGLHRVCSRFQEQLALIAHPVGPLDSAYRDLLEEWPGLTIGYLASPNQADTSEALVAYLQNLAWPVPLSEAAAAGLYTSLMAPWTTAESSVKAGEVVEWTSANQALAASSTDPSEMAIARMDDAPVLELPRATEGSAVLLLDEQDEEEEPEAIAESLGEEAAQEAEIAMESAEQSVWETEVDPTEAARLAGARTEESVEPALSEVETSEQAGEPAFAVEVEEISDAVGLDQATPSVREDAVAVVEEETTSWVDEALSVPARQTEVAEPTPDTTPIMAAEAVASETETVAEESVKPSGIWGWPVSVVEQGSGPSAIAATEEPGVETSTLDISGLSEVTEPELMETVVPALAEEVTAPERMEIADLEVAKSENLTEATEEKAEPVELEAAEPELAESEEWAEEVEEADEATELEKAPITFSNAEQELVELLQAEVSLMTEMVTDLEPVVTASDGDAEARSEALVGYAESAARLAEATEALGFNGLQQACIALSDNLLALSGEPRPLTAVEYGLAATWPKQAMAYLQAVGSPTACQALVAHLQDSDWPNPLPTEEAAELLTLLQTPRIALPEAEGEEARPQEALPEHISLALPEDVNPELLDSLLHELPDQTAELSAAIQRLASGQGSLGDVDVAQRIAHTVKGAGNTVGVRGIANLTHHMEDILLAFSKHKALPNSELADSLLTAADCLETMSESLIGLSPPPTEAQAVLQNVLDWANQIDREGLPADTATPPQTVRPVAAPKAAAAPEPAAKAADAAARAEPTAAEAMVRVPASLVDELLRLVGESIILTGQIQERARKALRQTKLMQAQHQVFQQLTADLEQMVEIRGVAPLADQAAVQGTFDPLEMERYNEFNTLTHRLLEAAADSRALDQGIREDLGELDDLLVMQGRLHRSSQETVLRTRMVPVKTIVPRLQRSVRQTCRLTDKEVDLVVSGDETLMDSNLLADITDPLMHVLRNAVDHGIESPERREALDKDPTGRIDLAFLREGDTIVVRCQDDGSGLNYPAILAAARERGFIAADAAPSEMELSQLILTPGFSTRSEATQTSGRGIGLDAVHTRVRELRGTFQIRSEAQRGCLVELRLPVTLIAIHALLVRMHGQRFAISSRGIEQALHGSLGQIRRLGAKSVYQVGDDFYEMVALDALLDLGHDRRSGARHDPSLLLVREGVSGTIRAVLVQEVMDSRDLVVKPLARYFPKLDGIVGATILGDGSVVPVLDLPELLRAPLAATGATPSGPAARPSAPAQPRSRQRLALVVDDSLSARRALAQAVEDAGFQVRTARDGLEAVAVIDAQRPDLLLVDLEMPRMNGLELTAHVRGRAETRNLPVIMVTSRSTAKHRQEAETVGVNFYITKPFSDDDLLQKIHEALSVSA